MNIQKAIRWVTLAALFIIPLIPVIPGITIANGFFFPFITGKNFTFRILVEVAFAGWAALAFIDKQYRPRFSWAGVGFIALVVWMAIADSFAVNPAKAFWSNFERMEGWVTLVHLLMFAVAASSMLAVGKLWRKWWFAYIVSTALLCGYSILQIMHVLQIHQGSTRVDATIGNSAYLAAYLLFSFALTLWLAWNTEKERKWMRYGLYALAVLEVIILFYTETRGAILGFIGAVILGSLLWMIEAGKKGRKAAIGILVAIALLVGGFLLVRHEAWVKNVPALGRLASISLSDSETTARFHIWNMALQGFAERPIVGWGQEGFNYVFNKYYSPSMYSQEPWFDRAHNVYFDWLIAGGAPALLLFLFVLGSVVIGLYRSSISRTERVLLISALGAYAFQGLFVFDNLMTYMPLFSVFAMAHGAFSKPIPQIESLKETTVDTWQTFVLPAAGVALVLVIWFVNVPGMRAATDLITAITPAADVTQNLDGFKQAIADKGFANQEIAEQMMTFVANVVTSQGVSDENKQAVATFAFQQMEAVLNKIPKDARLHIEYAYGLRAAGDYKDALAQVRIAEQLSPKKQSIIVEEGVDLWQSGDLPGAAAAFERAYELDTSFPKLAAYAAAGKIVTGHADAGRALLIQTFGTTTVDEDIVLLAYYTVKDNDDFIAVWRQRVIDQNRSAESEFGLAAALTNAKRYVEARAVMQQAAKDHPEYAAQVQQFLEQINTAAAGK